MTRYLILTTLLMLAACGHKEPEETTLAKPVVEVKTAKAEGAMVAVTLNAPATVFAREQANVTPRLTGVIRELKVRKGQRGALVEAVVDGKYKPTGKRRLTQH